MFKTTRGGKGRGEGRGGAGRGEEGRGGGRSGRVKKEKNLGK